MLVLPAHPARCTAQGSQQDYQRWSDYSERTSGLIYRDSVDPHWFGPEDRYLWYRIETAANSHEFVLVDAKNGERTAAFDHGRLASVLAKETEQQVDATSLDLQALEFTDEADECRFVFAGQRWIYALPDGPLSAAESSSQLANAPEGLPPQRVVARSRNSGDRTSIRFENRLDVDLKIQWVTADGALRP